MDIGKDYVNPQMRESLGQAKSVDEIVAVKLMYPALSLEDLSDGSICADERILNSDGAISVK